MWFVYMGRHNTIIVIHQLAQRGAWSISRQSTNWSNFTKHLRQLKREHQKWSFICSDTRIHSQVLTQGGLRSMINLAPKGVTYAAGAIAYSSQDAPPQGCRCQPCVIVLNTHPQGISDCVRPSGLEKYSIIWKVFESQNSVIKIILQTLREYFSGCR